MRAVIAFTFVLAPLALAIITVNQNRLVEDVCFVGIAALTAIIWIGWALTVGASHKNTEASAAAVGMAVESHAYLAAFAESTAITLAKALDALDEHDPDLARAMLAEQCDAFARFQEHCPEDLSLVS